jgi:hypothetical protein
MERKWTDIRVVGLSKKIPFLAMPDPPSGQIFHVFIGWIRHPDTKMSPNAFFVRT